MEVFRVISCNVMRDEGRMQVDVACVCTTSQFSIGNLNTEAEGVPVLEVDWRDEGSESLQKLPVAVE